MKNIKDEFIAYQDSFREIIEELINGYNAKPRRYNDWKGFITLIGPVVENPEILFIGINPGEGLYYETNPNKILKKDHKMPFRMLENNKYKNTFLFNEKIKFREPHYRKDNKTIIELDCFIDENYREGHWYDEKLKNTFPLNMVRIIYNVAKQKYGEKFEKGKKPKWYDDKFGKSIMHLNIYPIATKSTSELRKIIKNLKKSEIDVEQQSIAAIKNFVINALKPKVIVFAGKGAYYEFMGDNKKWKGKVISNNINDIPIVAFSRKGAWEIEKIAKKISQVI